MTDETHEEHCGLGSLAYSFLIGAATGAGLAMLFAPARGRDIRARIATKAREGPLEVLHRGRAAVKHVRAHAKDQSRHVSRAFSESREAVIDILTRGEKALKTISHEVAEAASDVKDAYGDVRADITGSK